MDLSYLTGTEPGRSFLCNLLSQRYLPNMSGMKKALPCLQGTDSGRNSDQDQGPVDVNFASILSLDASGGWYVLRISREGVVTGDEPAFKVLKHFYANAPGQQGSLPLPLLQEFSEPRDWGLSRTPSRNWRSAHKVQGNMKLTVNYIPDREGGYIVLKSGPCTASVDPSKLPLSEREREIVGWVAAGKTNSEIGQLLEISSRTVQKHLENIFRKLGVETRTALAMRAAGWSMETL